MTEPESAWQDHPAGYDERDDWFIEQERAWLDVLEGRAQPLCNLEQAEQTLMTTRAILESAEADGGWTLVESEVAHERA
jgi:predicted dehydrogenase